MAKSFHELQTRTQIVVFAALAVLTVGAAWQVLIGPMRAELATRRARLSTVDADVQRAQATAARLPALTRDIAALEQQLVATTAVLPDEKDAQDVLRQLHELASDSSLAIASFTPKPVADKPQYSEWPIELGLNGGYHDLGRFFDRVASLPLLISVSDLHVKASDRQTGAAAAGTGSVVASCTATTFVFRKDAPLPPAPGSAGASGVRGAR
jgi:type IV pilus assembly protein PilO